MNRRQAILTGAGAIATASEGSAAPDQFPLFDIVVQNHAVGVETYLKRQITDPAHRWRGGFADDAGLFWPGYLAGVLSSLAVGFVYERSKHYKNHLLLERMRLASDTLNRETSTDGNINNPITNWNSPPDTAFAVRGLALAASITRRANVPEVSALIEPWLKRAGASLARGGVHTPNHRWVVSAALAQLYELFKEPSYVGRVDQWLAEGIDIDEDGQYDERSTVVYNPITNDALTTIAVKLKRPQLLDPVRRNLDSMMYLLHPGYEVVTEISRRQDLNQRGDMGGYWFSLQYMAAHDKNGKYATLSRHFAPTRGSLAALLDYPEMNVSTPEPKAIPDRYVKSFPGLGLTHIRKGDLSACIFTGNSRFFTLRKGDAVLNAMRFATAFFGKGQFKAERVERQGDAWVLLQQLEAPYYQPFTPPRQIKASDWTATQKSRPTSEVMKLTQSVEIRETTSGFSVRVQAHGTKDVPVAIELSFRDGGKLEGNTCMAGKDRITFGPIVRVHNYTEIRGAEPKLPGTSVYLTGLTPFDHSLEFRLS